MRATGHKGVIFCCDTAALMDANALLKEEVSVAFDLLGTDRQKKKLVYANDIGRKFP